MPIAASPRQKPNHIKMFVGLLFCFRHVGLLLLDPADSDRDRETRETLERLLDMLLGRSTFLASDGFLWR